MTDIGTGGASGNKAEKSPAVSGPLSAVPQTPQKGSGSGQDTLSVDFTTPLVGAARAERISRMARNHPAFEKSRYTQDILVKAQHAVRRMPGVSGQEASELVAQLQEVGQMINQETVQLVDALMNLMLDQEESEKAMAKMSIDANLAQAKTDDQARLIDSLRAQVQAEKDRRGKMEADARQALQSLQTIGRELKALGDKAEERDDGGTSDDLVKVGESACEGDQGAQQEEEQHHQHHQHNQHHQHHQREGQVVRAGTAQAGADGGDGSLGHDLARLSVGELAASGLQLAKRPRTAAPPRFEPLPAAPPRAPAAMLHDRRFHAPVPGPWGGSGSGSGGPAPARPSAYVPGPAPCRSGFQPLPRYRPVDHHHHHAPAAGFGAPPDLGRPPSAFGHARDGFPATPTSAGRGRLARLPDAAAPPGELGGGAPAVHVSDQAVAAWHEHIMDLYGAIRVFVEHHAGDPDAGLAAQLAKTGLWSVLLATYHPLAASEAASYLDFHLRNENSKSCVVTRLVVDYVVNRVWVPAAWTGLDAQTTFDLLEVQRHLDAAHSQPAAARQPLLDRQAALVAHVLKAEPLGSAWHRAKVDGVARLLHDTLLPLLNRRRPGAPEPRDAVRDLGSVAALAWDLSARMLTSRLTFDFRFPEIGARFSAQSMLPIWPPVDPAELQAKHWRVALVTTPAITCRNDTGAGISTHSVALADVFCMQ